VITRLRKRSDAVAPLKKPERPKDTDEKAARRLVGLLLVPGRSDDCPIGPCRRIAVVPIPVVMKRTSKPKALAAAGISTSSTRRSIATAGGVTRSRAHAELRAIEGRRHRPVSDAAAVDPVLHGAGLGPKLWGANDQTMEHYPICMVGSGLWGMVGSGFRGTVRTARDEPS
jgi:hypothetical protein